ncbi:MAG: hypothetical protein HYU64_21445 [Armatimonadetes bacterium]|nr:hypothetical protein [Armatimonadota bacterium]
MEISNQASPLFWLRVSAFSEALSHDDYSEIIDLRNKPDEFAKKRDPGDQEFLEICRLLSRSLKDVSVLKRGEVAALEKISVAAGQMAATAMLQPGLGAVITQAMSQAAQNDRAFVEVKR